MTNENLENYQDDIRRVQEFYDAFAFNLDKAPSDGGWTASQCLAHICDAEISLSLRVRMILTSDNYHFSSWDEDAFAVIKKDRDPRISVETFTTLRRNNLDLFGSLDADPMQRIGIRTNAEPISLIDYVAQMSRHARAHIEQAVAAAK